MKAEHPHLSRMSTKISFLCIPLFCPPDTGFCMEEEGAVFVLRDYDTDGRKSQATAARKTK